MKLMQILNEYLSNSELDAVEQYADRLFKALHVDIEFTNHFIDRVNDSRNGKPIDMDELKMLFFKAFNQKGAVITKLDDRAEAILNDMQTDINVPFVLDLNSKGELELISKTIMRKKDFRSSSPKLQLT